MTLHFSFQCKLILLFFFINSIIKTISCQQKIFLKILLKCAKVFKIMSDINNEVFYKNSFFMTKGESHERTKTA